MGRKDVTLPGTHTTFIVHCKKVNNQNVFRFEILDTWKRPSGYYFYANPTYYQYGVYAYKAAKVKAKYDYRLNFIIQRLRGPVMAIRMQGKAGARADSEKSNWLKFSDERHGYVSGYQNLYHRGKFPSMADTFSLEAGICAKLSSTGKFTT